jgi:tRNA(fMet)-specific endonuclease VapC
MSFLLDTNICSAYLKQPRGLTHRFIQHSGGLHVASIVLGELYTWALRRSDPAPALQAIADELLPHLTILDFDHRCAHEFGRVHATLLNLGRPVDAVDMQIAATALVHNLTLVTHNTKDYQHVPGLRLEDWLTP